jgi:hypothetical protein
MCPINGSAIADSAINTFYGRSEIIFRYSSSGKAGYVSMHSGSPPHKILLTGIRQRRI